MPDDIPIVSGAVEHAEHGAHGVKGMLTKRYGPLPGWGWACVIVGGAVIGWRVSHMTGGAASSPGAGLFGDSGSGSGGGSGNKGSLSSPAITSPGTVQSSGGGGGIGLPLPSYPGLAPSNASQAAAAARLPSTPAPTLLAPSLAPAPMFAPVASNAVQPATTARGALTPVADTGWDGSNFPGPAWADPANWEGGAYVPDRAVVPTYNNDFPDSLPNVTAWGDPRSYEQQYLDYYGAGSAGGAPAQGGPIPAYNAETPDASLGVVPWYNAPQEPTIQLQGNAVGHTVDAGDSWGGAGSIGEPVYAGGGGGGGSW